MWVRHLVVIKIQRRLLYTHRTKQNHTVTTMEQKKKKKITKTKNKLPEHGSLGTYIIDDSGGLISNRRVCIVSRSRISETSRFPNHHITRALRRALDLQWLLFTFRRTLLAHTYNTRTLQHTRVYTTRTQPFDFFFFSPLLLVTVTLRLAVGYGRRMNKWEIVQGSLWSVTNAGENLKAEHEKT